MSSEPKKGGRRTKDQEIDLYLESLGIDRAELEATGKVSFRTQEGSVADAGSFTELRDRALASLAADYDSLSGVAKVQAFRVIQQLAKEEPDGGAEAEDEPLIADVIAGNVLLPLARKKEILERELAKLDEERAAILGVLNG